MYVVLKGMMSAVYSSCDQDKKHVTRDREKMVNRRNIKKLKCRTMYIFLLLEILKKYIYISMYVNIYF